MAVLVVHREGSDRSASVEALRREGFDVRPTANPFRAVSEFAGRRVDCVVLDIGPLGERDLDVIPVLKELAPGVPVILTFPPAQRELAARGLTLGADVYLPEPYYMEELIALVRRATTRPLTTRPASPPDDLLQQLAADAAHEINNPLQVIQLLHDGETGRLRPARTKVKPHLDRVGAVGRLLAELGQLPREPAHTSVNLAAILEDARSHVPQASEEPIDPVRPVSGFPDFLGAVLEGLLRRASHGKETVSSSCADSSEDASGGVEIVIEGHTWEPSERTAPGEDPAHGPLFLTFVRIVMHRHGGVLEVREEPGEPMRYRLLLPALAPAEEVP